MSFSQLDNRITVKQWTVSLHLVTSAFSTFKMAGRVEKPLDNATKKYSKNRGILCHVTHHKLVFSEVISSVWQPCLSYGNLKPLFKRYEDISYCLITLYFRDTLISRFGEGHISQHFTFPSSLTLQNLGHLILFFRDFVDTTIIKYLRYLT